MCFYNDDYEWTAEVNDWSYVRTGKSAKCDECGRQILPGEWRLDVFQQEHEECQLCEDYWSDDFLGDPADFEEGDPERVALEEDIANCLHDYGETFEGSCCRECLLLLAAVYDLERIEGCPENARQPAFGELEDALQYENGQYERHAVKLFPELATHKFVLRRIA